MIYELHKSRNFDSVDARRQYLSLSLWSQRLACTSRTHNVAPARPAVGPQWLRWPCLCVFLYLHGFNATYKLRKTVVLFHYTCLLNPCQWKPVLLMSLPFPNRCLELFFPKRKLLMDLLVNIRSPVSRLSWGHQWGFIWRQVSTGAPPQCLIPTRNPGHWVASRIRAFLKFGEGINLNSSEWRTGRVVYKMMISCSNHVNYRGCLKAIDTIGNYSK